MHLIFLSYMIFALLHSVASKLLQDSFALHFCLLGAASPTQFFIFIGRARTNPAAASQTLNAAHQERNFGHLLQQRHFKWSIALCRHEGAIPQNTHSGLSCAAAFAFSLLPFPHLKQTFCFTLVAWTCCGSNDIRALRKVGFQQNSHGLQMWGAFPFNSSSELQRAQEKPLKSILQGWPGLVASHSMPFLSLMRNPWGAFSVHDFPRTTETFPGRENN